MSMQFHCGRHSSAVLLVVLLSRGASRYLQAQMGGAGPHDSSVKVPSYEVVSIKPASPGDRNVGWKDLPNGFDFANLPLAPLIYQAYGIQLDSQISGLPGWAKTDHYIVSARADEDTVEAWKKLPKPEQWKQQQLMLRTLFADRCKLAVRREVKELPVYDLVVAKGRPKMKEAAPDEEDRIDLRTNSFFGAAGQSVEYAKTMTARAITAQGLAQNLPRDAGRIILDKTSLGDKRFDFELKWSSGGQDLPDAANAAPSLFKALEEQLGLKLESAKEPVDTFVVEHMEQPSAN